MLNLQRRDWIAVVMGAIGFGAVAGGVQAIAGPWAAALIGGGVVLVVLLVAAVLYRHVEDRLEDARVLAEASTALQLALKPTVPLPPLRGYALAPDSAVLLYNQLAAARPRTVVETGSGVSTLIIGYALKAQGQGRLVTLELDEEHAQRTRAEVARHGLEAQVTVVHAPLREVTVDGARFRWHDPAALAELDAIDFVFDDGPPRRLGPQLRAAALPLIRPRLSEGAVYLLNFIADEERRTIARWLEQFPEFEAETVRSKKGNVILRRRRKG
jgi:predicted O-methyltransferase YrrM